MITFRREVFDKALVFRVSHKKLSNLSLLFCSFVNLLIHRFSYNGRLKVIKGS